MASVGFFNSFALFRGVFLNPFQFQWKCLWSDKGDEVTAQAYYFISIRFENFVPCSVLEPRSIHLFCKRKVLRRNIWSLLSEFHYFVLQTSRGEKCKLAGSQSEMWEQSTFSEVYGNERKFNTVQKRDLKLHHVKTIGEV